jgi:hypothetical protein
MIHQPQTTAQLAVNGDIWHEDLALWQMGTPVCAECGDLLLGWAEIQIGLCTHCHHAEEALIEEPKQTFKRVIYRSRPQ